MCSFYFFFFKQKTAYEMRISDWSSDVCSSDLRQCGEFLPEATVREMRAADAVLFGAMGGPELDEVPAEQRRAGSLRAIRRDLDVFANLRPVMVWGPMVDSSSLKRETIEGVDLMIVRSEEHTSELQSLMRIS